MSEWLIGKDFEVTTWVARQIKVREIRHVYKAFGVVKDGELIAGVVLSQYTGFDVWLSGAATKRDWLSRRLIVDLADFVFNDLKCVRMTAVCKKQNKHARQMLVRLGFREEGTLKKGYDGINDAVFYGMLGDDSKWLLTRD